MTMELYYEEFLAFKVECARLAELDENVRLAQMFGIPNEGDKPD